MRRGLGVVAAGLAVLGACSLGGRPQNPPRAAPFQAQGEAGYAQSGGAGLPTSPEGIRTLGAFRLQLTSFRSSDGRCRVEPASSVKIAYTSRTRFRPPEIKQVGFPGSLEDQVVDVQGKAYRVGHSCVQVADDVHIGGAAMTSLPEPSTTPEAPDTRDLSKRPAAPQLVLPQPESVPAVSPDAAAVESLLPSPAPTVRSTLRPSLPNPPASAS